jgi:cystathionine beta-lyase/cystathionine gamma-synthase
MSGITTNLIHNGYDPGRDHGAVVPPIHLSTTYVIGHDSGYDYSRSGNPSRDLLEKTLAELDGGTYGLAFSSGSAALAVTTSLLKEGEEILFSRDAYGGTFRYITQVLTRLGKKYRVVDFTNLQETEALLAAHPVKLVWVETPTNPLLKVADLQALAGLAHAHGARLAVDNTFATPVIQKPLRHGADIVSYSTTKYLNGHSDSIGGALIVNDKHLYKDLKFFQNATGAILSPFDSWLTLRGLRTLELRVERHVANARKVAELLRDHPKVKYVYYPAFFTGEQGKIVAKQQSSPGAIITIDIDGKYDVQTFLRALRYFPLAESLGGFESLINHPATMTHAAIPREERTKIGLGDNILRLSVGIENADDLVEDIRQALEKLR